MKTKKLNKSEQAAQSLCNRIHDLESYDFTVEWVKSTMWGSNPVIRYRDAKTCSVSGCGYCKHSTALADTLRFLFPQGSDEHNKIWQTGGCGVSSVISTLADCGWKLESVASSRITDSYRITKIEE